MNNGGRVSGRHCGPAAARFAGVARAGAPAQQAVDISAEDRR
jgi:hypothetical protein